MAGPGSGVSSGYRTSSRMTVNSVPDVLVQLVYVVETTFSDSFIQVTEVLLVYTEVKSSSYSSPSSYHTSTPGLKKTGPILVLTV